MNGPESQRLKIDAFLVTDETRFLEMHYPEYEYQRPSPGTPQVPRDAYSITINEAAKILRMTRAGAYKMIVERCAFSSTRKVGPPTSPIYLTDVREVREEARRRVEA
jgi:hypothetical protein